MKTSLQDAIERCRIGLFGPNSNPSLEPVPVLERAQPTPLEGAKADILAKLVTQRPTSTTLESVKVILIPSTPEQLAALELAEIPNEAISRGGLELLQTVLECAYHWTLDNLQVKPAHVSSVVIHLPIELVAACMGRARSSVSLWAAELQDLGVLRHAPHVSTCEEGNRNDGTLWAVSLHPARVLEGKAAKAKLSVSDFQKVYRDLDKDRKLGHTVYALKNSLKTQIGHSKTLQESREGIKYLVGWTLSDPQIHTKPVKLLNVRGAKFEGKTVIYALSDAFIAETQTRGEVIAHLAAQLAKLFNDHQSEKFWMFTLWRLVKLADRGINWFGRVQMVLERVYTAQAEGFARKPGAMVAAELQRLDLWDHLKAA